MVHHQPPIPHAVLVTVYETDEAPNHNPHTGSGHRSMLKRPAIMPTPTMIRHRLETPAAGESP